MTRWRRICAMLGLVWGAASVAGCDSREAASDAEDPLLVFAAASLGPVLESLAPALSVALDFPVVYNHAASSALARQIDAGAPAAVFVSANVDWMDWLADRGGVVAGSRRAVAGNSLVIVAPRGHGFLFSGMSAGTSAGTETLAEAFEGRFAMADPAHVPAGIYAKQALEHAGWWDALEVRVVAAMDARAALALVERGECMAGVIYRSDAVLSDRVEIVAELPHEWHPEVLYPGAIIAGPDSTRARAWLDALSSLPVTRRLEEYGFRPLRENKPPC